MDGEEKYYGSICQEDRSRINLWMKRWPEITLVGVASVFSPCWRNSIPIVIRSGLKTFS